MTGYKRPMTYEQTGIPWIAPSPNMPTVETALIYPGFCLFEGTNLSEGRGTDAPFLTIGAPYINAKKWLASLPSEVLTGVSVEPISFTPRSIKGKAEKPKYLNKKCHGLRFQIDDKNKFHSIELALALMASAQKLYPNNFIISRGMDRLWGDENLRAMIPNGEDHNAILRTTESGLKTFNIVRKQYLLYP